MPSVCIILAHRSWLVWKLTMEVSLWLTTTTPPLHLLADLLQRLTRAQAEEATWERCAIRCLRIHSTHGRKGSSRSRMIA
jgi:hypothetical protein